MSVSNFNHNVIAVVRQHGAIGMFYNMEFPITDQPTWKDEWFELYGEDLELYHFVGEPFDPVTRYSKNTVDNQAK